MKMNKSFNRYFSTVLVVLAFTVVSMFLLSGCSKTKEITSETTQLAQESSTQSSQAILPVDHSVDTGKEPLTDNDQVLSLDGYGAKGALIDMDLTIHDMLMYAVQDEYLAHGEYLSIIEKFGSQKPYSNIINSEETHLAYLEEIFIAYKLEFPADSSADHIVVPADLLEAAKTGVQAEIDNIAMYEHFLTYDLPEDINEVFSALKSGSDSHLLAFQKQVERLE